MFINSCVVKNIKLQPIGHIYTKIALTAIDF